MANMFDELSDNICFLGKILSIGRLLGVLNRPVTEKRRVESKQSNRSRLITLQKEVFNRGKVV